MAGQSITFDFLTRGADTTASGFRKVGDNTLLAARGAKVLADTIKTLGEKENRTAAESKILAGALRQTGDAEDRVAAKAVLADAAVRRLDDALKDSAKDSRKANAEAGGLGKTLGGLKVNPGLLGPAVALAPALASLSGVAAGAAVGLGGAFLAGGAALAAFGVVAKPVLADAQKAAQKVNTAQNNYNVAIATGTKQSVAYKAEQKAIGKAYAELSPQQIALSKQLGNMASAWQDLKAKQTPVVAGALQPWLKSVTDLTKNLAPIIAKVAPVVGYLGTKFDSLVNSSAFRGFRDFIGSTGAAAVSAGGSTIIDLVKSFMILLPKFDPLIREAIGWISRLGPAVLKWSSSKKASDDIQKFLQWFSRNGPLVGGLLKNIGGALKALAPGLGAGAAEELKIVSGFFGFVAKLPPAVAKPLAEVAGALLILNKLGVFPVGVKLIGAAAGWVKKLLSGAAVDLGAAGMQAAGDTMAAAAAAMQRAADTMAGGAVAGSAAGGAAAGGGAAAAGTEGVVAGGLMSKLAPGLKWAVKGGILVAAAKIALSIAGSEAPKASAPQIRSFQKSTPGGVRKFLDFFFGSDVNTASVSAYIKKLFGPAANWGPQQVFDLLRSKIAGSFDTSRHQVASFGAFVAGSFDTTRHQAARIWGVLTGDISASFDIAKEGIRITWDQIKLLFLGGTDFIMTVMGKLPKPLGAPFRAAHKSIAGEMAGIQRDVATATGNMQADIDRLHGKNVPVTVSGSGSGGVVITTSGIAAAGQGNVRFHAAAGALIRAGTGPRADDVPAMLSRGELVVPTHMVNAGAVDHLRGRIPGFASGGFAGVESALGRVTGVAADVEGRGAAAAMAAGAKAAIATARAAIAKAGTSSPVGNIGSGVGRWAGLVKQVLAMEHLNPAYILDVLYQMQTESGGNPNAINLTDSNAAAGDPSRGLMQTIMSTFLAYHWPGTSFNIYDPEANIAAALNYGAHGRGFGGGPGQIGSGHGYAEGGLVSGFASGGTVGRQGAAYLNAWRTRHGGGFGAAWGPVPVNPQIDRANRALALDTTLSQASLPAAQHRHYVAAAAWWRRHRDALVRERGVMRDWRGQLGGSDQAIGTWIAAAGKNKALAPSVGRWKHQRAVQEKEIAAVSKMLGWSASQQAAIARAHPPKPGTPGGGPALPKITHTYGGDIADTIGAFLASVAAPFGAARGALVMDRGGWLRPGWNATYNGTGRPEHLLPARGSGGGDVHLHVHGPVGSEAELERWLTAAIRKGAKTRGGGSVERAYSAH